MGSAFDDFSHSLSRTRGRAPASREAEREQFERRSAERNYASGRFPSLPIEWWHYDALQGKKSKLYKIVE